MNLSEFIREMPKTELHVHLEGAIQPETILILAQKNHITLPVDNLEDLRAWYQFRDFSHFVEIYVKISECIQSAEDLELVTREFLNNQAKQHILYSEVIFTPYTHFKQKGLTFSAQLEAIKRGIAWARENLHVDMGIVMDISRETSPAEGVLVANWAIDAMHEGIIGLGLGGPEVGNPPEKFKEAFDLAHQAGLAALPHAGETDGPASIWGALETLHGQRILHGVRCLEDVNLVKVLRERQIPLDVCPTSNICLGVFPSMTDHPLPRLLKEGLYITLNSDDPPMFNTSLTNEYLAITQTFGFEKPQLRHLVLNGVYAALLPSTAKARMAQQFNEEFDRLLQSNG